jgi:integrase/recombinase XerD
VSKLPLSFAKLAAQFQTVDLQTLLWLNPAKANRAGLCPISLRITIDKRRLERSTGLRVAPSEWDAKSHCLKGKSVLVQKQNEQLQLLKAHVSELVNLMKATGRLVTARTLALQLDAPSLGQAPCFIALCQQQLDLHYGGSPVNYAARLHGLRTFIDWRGRDKHGNPVPLPVEEFTPELATVFYTWLLSVRRLKVSTANAVVSTLATLFRRAAEAGLVELADNPFRLLRKKKKTKVERLRLSLAQFATLQNAPLSAKAALARDVYVAQYYLHGSRVGAVLKLRWQDVSPTHVRLQTEKGGPLKSIRLAPELARVLARYHGAETSPADLVFPLLPAAFYSLEATAQFAARKSAVVQLNKALRLAGQAVGLPDGLHSHTARHTLALHAAVAAGMHVTQKLLGHARMSQTEDYVGELPDEALNEAERLLYGTGSTPPPTPTPPTQGGRVVPFYRAA